MLSGVVMKMCGADGLLLTFLRRCVAGSDADPDQRLGLAFLPRKLRELPKRFLEVSVDVVRERLQGRHIQAVDSVLKLATQLLCIQLVDDRQERGEGLAAPGRGRDEDALPRVNQRDSVRLRFREVFELRLEPVPDQGFHEPQDFVFRGCGADLM